MTEVVKAGEFTIRHNTKQKMRQLRAFSKAVRGPLLRDAFRLSLDYIGQVSAADFWITTRGIGMAAMAAVHPSILTMRTGRLIASVVGAFRFSEVNLPSPMARFAARPFTSSGEGFEKGKSEAIREVDIGPGGIRARIGTRVPYGKKHELGQRPFLRPAVDRAMPMVERILGEAIEGDFKIRRI